MSQAPTPQVRPPAPGADRLVESLVSEFAEEKRKERERESRHRNPARRFVAPAVAAVASLAAWVAPVPEAGDSPAPPSAQYTMASARMTLVLASRRLESFRAQYRRLPTTLDDAGIVDSQMQYRASPEGAYTLKLPVQGSMLTLASNGAHEHFLQDASSIIRRTAK